MRRLRGGKMHKRKILRWKRGAVHGTICMPLQKNVPNGAEGWTLTTCPKCGAACWWRPEQELLEKSGGKALCTQCALRE